LLYFTPNLFVSIFAKSNNLSLYEFAFRFTLVSHFVYINSFVQHFIGSSGTLFKFIMQELRFESCEWKNTIKRRDSTMFDQPRSSTVIDYLQSW